MGSNRTRNDRIARPSAPKASPAVRRVALAAGLLGFAAVAWLWIQSSGGERDPAGHSPSESSRGLAAADRNRDFDELARRDVSAANPKPSRSSADPTPPGIAVGTRPLGVDPRAPGSGSDALLPVAGVRFRWVDAEGRLGAGESDGLGRISLANVAEPVLGLLDGSGIASRVVLAHPSKAEGGWEHVAVEPTGDLRVSFPPEANLDLAPLDPRCDPVWIDVDGVRGLSELQSAHWELAQLTAALEAWLGAAPSEADGATSTAELLVATRTQLFSDAARVVERLKDDPTAELLASLSAGPKRTIEGGSVVWRDLPVRLPWVWSLARSVGLELLPTRSEWPELDHSTWLASGLLQGRAVSQPLRLTPARERSIDLDGKGPATLWVHIPRPPFTSTDGDAVSDGVVRLMQRHGKVNHRLLETKACNGSGVIRFDHIPPGEISLVSDWQSGPAERSVRVDHLELAPGEVRDLGTLAVRWGGRMGVRMDLSEAGAEGADAPALSPVAVLRNPDQARPWLRIPLHGDGVLDESLFVDLRVGFQEDLALFGLAPAELHLSMGWSPILGAGIADETAMPEPLPGWRIVPLPRGELQKDVEPIGQLERFRLLVERTTAVAVALEPPRGNASSFPWAHYWLRQAELIPLAGGESVKPEPNPLADPARIHFRAAPGRYALFVRLEPRPEHRDGTANSAEYPTGLWGEAVAEVGTGESAIPVHLVQGAAILGIARPAQGAPTSGIPRAVPRFGLASGVEVLLTPEIVFPEGPEGTWGYALYALAPGAVLHFPGTLVSPRTLRAPGMGEFARDLLLEVERR